eukprot:TRINITY_DN5683_c0_g2_i2.p1 TRINITY_DN5683_c0_g2~~TRINITY_DN5683_c0_g2_i2.p1  ORF type:complete len:610 (-),score=131.14 TRINITY_DN5683_c0_g2_i2:36-1835(-)
MCIRDRYLDGFINRQIILLLMTLGVPDENFVELINRDFAEIDNYGNLSDNSIFLAAKHRDDEVLDNDNVYHLLKGFYENLLNDNDPFLNGVVYTIRARKYFTLRKKTNIRIKKSVRIIGVLDEYRVLDEEEVFAQLINENDPDRKNERKIIVRNQEVKDEIIQYLKENWEKDPFLDNPKNYDLVILEKMMLTKNPCLHPGDIRIVYSIDSLAKFVRLRHLINVIVFPQKGIIPITCQIAGSDLDGDLYFLTWEPLIIPERTSKPFDYDSFPEKESRKKFTRTDMIEFFVKFMLFSCLGRVDNAHLAIGDFSKKENYALSKKCLELFQLHALSIDFAKTDVDINELEFPKVKIWPDFMEKPKDEFDTVDSQTVQGRLFRMARTKQMKFFEQKLQTQIVSPDVSFAYNVSSMSLCIKDDFIHEAVVAWKDYHDKIALITNLFGASNEFELFSGNFIDVFVSTKKNPSQSADLKDRVYLHILQMVQDLRNVFNQSLMIKVDFSIKDDDAFFASIKANPEALFKASIWYVISYLPLSDENLSLLTEEWLAVLGETFDYQYYKDEMVNFLAQREFQICYGLPWFTVSRISVSYTHLTLPTIYSV